jgi:hypothetical protein
MLAANTPKNSGNGTVRTVMSIILFIVFCIVLYQVYNYLYGSNVAQASVEILKGTVPCTTTLSATKPVVAATALTGVLDGGQYSTSFWVYIADTKGFSSAGGASLAHLMDISSGSYTASPATGNTLIFIGLNPTNGALIVRQSTSDNTSSKIDNSMTTGYTSTNYSVQDITTNYNTGSKYTSKDSCDIINGIEYQRWVLITAVANSRTLDVYIDGKLVRSCVYKAPFALSAADGKGTATFGYNNNGNLKGFFANGNFYNYALTPDAVWALYQAGPGGGFSISNFFSNLVSVNVNFGSISTATAPASVATP